MADATWTGYAPANWTISNPSVTKSSGSSWGSSVYATAQSATDTYGHFICKWNSGDATVVVGISTLAYITANGNDELGLQYGFKFKPYATTNYSTVHNGSNLTSNNYAIDSNTEFKLTYEGGDIKYYVDDVLIDTVTVALSGTFYLWTNNNRASGDGSIQCQQSDEPIPTTHTTRLPPPPIVLSGL